MDDPREQQAPTSAASGTSTVPCRFDISDSGLCITEVRVSPRGEDKLKAFVSITLNDSMVIRGIKIIEGRERLFVAMPSRPKSDGSFQDTVHPINQETRKRMESHILNIFYDSMSRREIR